MLEKTFSEVVEIIEATTTKTFTENQLRVYKLMLDDIPDEKFLNGITRLLKERVYSNLPPVAEIREYCLGLKENDLIVKVEEAKKKLKEAIRKYGSYRNVAFDDPIIHLIVQSESGWTKLLTKSNDEMENFYKWDFPKLFKAYSTSKHGEIPLILKGLAYESDSHVNVIGDLDRYNKWTTAYENRKVVDVKKVNGVHSTMIG